MQETDIIALAHSFPRFHPEVTLGIGDDAAVLLAKAESQWLWTTDLLIEDVHFRRASFSPQDLAHKALAVNLSDLAAMAGQPLAFTLGLALPQNLEASWIVAFFEGLYQAAAYWQVDLIGGDTTRSQGGIVIAISLLGKATQPRLQSQAQPGDVLVAYGDFGAAAAGLYCLEQKLQGYERLKQKQRRPMPLLEAAHQLSDALGGQRLALTDASDGLGRSLQLLCGADFGCQVDLEQVPVLPEVWALAEAFAQNPWEWIVHGGEDYALLASLAPEQQISALNLGWQALGKVLPSPPLCLNRKGAEPLILTNHAGFQHFDAV